jgi:hypothetical protein
MKFSILLKKSKIRRVSNAVQAAFALTCVSLVAAPAQADLASVTTIAKKLYNNTTAVKETIFKDLYRIEFGPNAAVFYINDAATLILETNNVSIQNWTQPVQKSESIANPEKTKMLNAILHNIRFDKLIQIKQGKGTNKVLLLSAHDCPFCIQFEKMLAGAGDKLDISFFIIPSALDARDLQRRQNVQNIWCAPNNGKVWREGVVKPTLQYPNNNVPGCSLSYADARDFLIIMNTLNIRTGYPFMFADNGLPLTPDTDLKEFKAQLDQGTHKSFWSPDALNEFPSSLYSQFRVDKASARGWYK